MIDPNGTPQRDWPPPSEPAPTELAPVAARGAAAALLHMLREMLQVIAPALVLALVVHLFLAQATVVYGQSMEPNLHAQQRLIVDKLSYRLHSPQRNDIVVVDLPVMDEMLVKRIVALPGERVEVRGGIVYVNDQPIPEPYPHDLTAYDMPSITLGPLSYFVMGDNRGNSNDSRSFGPITAMKSSAASGCATGLSKSLSSSDLHFPTAMRVADAAAHLADCRLCPFLCGTARAEARGVCRVGTQSYIASEMLHVGEEMELRPAHAVFFSGCTASCTFCTAARFAFRPTYGVAVAPEQLAARIVQRQQEGARSLCFIGGDPAPHIPFILATLAALGTRRAVPAVFNSNFYLTGEALDLLMGAIDIYLPDLKFGPAAGSQSCGERIGGMPGYWEVVTGCIERVHAQGQRLIVRHLLMPGHFECCTRPVLTWLAGLDGVEVSLLTQYLAPAHARGELAQALSGEEISQATALAAALGLRLAP